MIKIAHICTSPTGGAGIAAYRLHCGLLQSRECSSVVVCLWPGKHTDDTSIIQVAQRPLTITEKVLRKFNWYTDKQAHFNQQLAKVPGKYEIATWPQTHYAVELEKAVLDADIVHLHWVAGFVNYPTFFKSLKNKIIVWTLHDMNPFMGIFHYQGDESRNPGLHQLNKRALKIKSVALNNSKVHVVALSNWIAAEAQKNKVFGRFTYTSIPNGVNLNVFKPVNKGVAKQHLNIPANEHTLLFISENIDNYRKGIDILIEALALVKSSKPLRVISVGHGNLQLPEHINYTPMGAIFDEAELARIYAASDMFVIPSREDNLPNVMVEAFACGTPVVGFAIGGLKQYVIPFKTGILANNITTTDFARAIETCLENLTGFDQAYISDFARQNFDDELQASSHVNFYKQLLKGKN
ncbi:glycosyltransferase [Mucilaginibacter terrae]|uniref:glycosyltransferase n=1 Tax=Mucilaginibacter terrae TaxID=1955052 RepID=UPI00362DA36D